jgi:hypothetical protein
MRGGDRSLREISVCLVVGRRRRERRARVRACVRHACKNYTPFRFLVCMQNCKRVAAVDQKKVLPCVLVKILILVLIGM